MIEFDSLNLNDKVLFQLEQVIDPELGIDIVNLGLVYGIEIKERICYLTMTLTTPGCPLVDVIQTDVDDALTILPEVEEVKIDFVFTPRWTIDNMTRYARIALGLS